MNGSSGLLFGRSKVRRELLAYLFTEPDRRAHASALARRLGHSPQAVARELRRLERAGVVSSEQVGRARRYGVNPDSPTAAELRALIEKTIGVEPLLQDALRDVPGIERALVFGSFARGDARPTSDIDLLVVGRPDQVLLGERLAGLERRLGRDINVATYERHELRRLELSGDSFVTRVLSEGVTIVNDPRDRPAD